ncbi:MAG: hypothetical protein KDK64_06395 [Chlamydiia bacterium]|nr:hypothetical protein [Chlamydiia bacterium]
MNLLPFTVVILIILALFSTSSFEQHRTESQKQIVYQAYFRTLRAARNHKEDLAYRSLNHSQKKSESKESPKKKKKIRYFREEKIGWDNGRLNLSSLTSDAQKWPKLKGVAARYVNRLYGHLDFFPKSKNFSEKLIDALAAAYKEKDADTPFHEIELDPPYHIPFSKMVKGTQTYDLKKSGYPPFGNFFTFEKREKPPMFFQDANLTFLALILGAEGAAKLEEKELAYIEEKQKHSSEIQRPDLEQMLKDHPPDPMELDLFDFTTYHSTRKPGKAQDPQTGITVRVP